MDEKTIKILKELHKEILAEKTTRSDCNYLFSDGFDRGVEESAKILLEKIKELENDYT